MFKDKYPLTWSFYRGTCRSDLNVLLPENVESSPEGYKEYLSAPTVLLPDVKIPLTDFTDLLFSRYSCRKYKDRPLRLQDVCNVLFAAYGVRSVLIQDNNEFMERTVPSGGGLYPLEFYLLVSRVEGLEPGIYHYTVYPAMLEHINTISLPKSFLQNLFMQQPYVADAQVVIVATAVVERTMKKYFDRGFRYILFEAGHAFQNMNLMAMACELGSLNIGGFFETDLCKVLGIDIEAEIPIYAMALGVPDEEHGSARVPDKIE